MKLQYADDEIIRAVITEMMPMNKYLQAQLSLVGGLTGFFAYLILQNTENFRI